MNNGLGIAIGIEGVPKILELLAEFLIVIDLAIENYPGGLILIVDRLLAALDINDRQTPHSQSNVPIDIETIIVWPTVLDGHAHAREQGLVDGAFIAAN
jgi:hypothetical protein